MLSIKRICTHSRLYTYLQKISCWLLPATCLLCYQPTQSASNLCRQCTQDLPILTQPCPRCAQNLPPASNNPLVCGTCLKNPPPFAATYALFPYAPPIIQLILQLKFKQRLSHAQLFAELLLSAIRQRWYRKQHLPDLIIPVPLHPSRLRERGFNQALEIARPVAKALRIPIDINGLVRVKATAPQSVLPANQRKQNIAHAFAAKRDYSGLSVAIVDDVVTTGHTITACCNTLKKSGANQLTVWCCARRSQ